MENPTIKIELKLSDLNRIVNLLATLQYSHVYDLIEQLRIQTIQQTTKS